MEDIIQMLLANNLKDLQGLHIKGTVPVDPALINKVIDSFLKPEPKTKKKAKKAEAATAPEPAPRVAATETSPTSSSTAKAAPDVDYVALAQKLVKELNVGVANGKIVTNFEIRVD